MLQKNSKVKFSDGYNNSLKVKLPFDHCFALSVVIQVSTDKTFQLHNLQIISYSRI